MAGHRTGEGRLEEDPSFDHFLPEKRAIQKRYVISAVESIEKSDNLSSFFNKSKTYLDEDSCNRLFRFVPDNEVDGYHVDFATLHVGGLIADKLSKLNNVE